MPEWPNGTVSKTVVLLRVPRVRIPLFPQIMKGQSHVQKFFSFRRQTLLAMPYRGLQALVGGDLGSMEGLERGGCGNLG